ncbi:hypothetical protein M758_5G197300 [Ceratodon purpureus]|uniref:Protein cereblon n=1 Tax=Ceratodon purpureus TaxID=3225 RepID=A0A8T0I4S9_CERPU|nr:hypothetical protein KC19_5G203400 [Ceratodon purpureus]KAG0617540.1 hypothetical protein M758_5G197300 [Ceratodon purpureus]
MCGAVEIQDREASLEYGESSCAEAGAAGEGYEPHATDEQYREAALSREQVPDADAEEAAEVFSEGEMAPREDFSHHQGGGHWEPREALNFDTNLASMHTYLGGLGEVEDIGNERFNGAGGAVLRLPMFYLEGIVLFPGQKLPLRVLQQRFKAAVCHAMDPVANDAIQTLGVIHVRVSRSGRIHVANYGTTAKICKAKEQRDGSVNVMTKGVQRFRILSVWTQPDGALFAQVQIIEEDTKTLGYFSRHMNTAFGPLASTFNRRNGRDKQNPTTSLPHCKIRVTHVSSVDEFVEESEDEEQFGHQHEALIRAIRAAQEEAEAYGDRNGDQDGDESDDLIAALTGEEDEQDSSDDDDSSTDSDFERPSVRQRSNDGASIGRRLEEMEPLGREPTEGRNRTEREPPLEARDNAEASHLQEVRSADEGEDKVKASVQDLLALSKDTSQVVSVSGVRPQGGPYANAYRMWRKDASRWSMRAQLTALPHWVYRQYDTFDLARRAADMLGQMGDHPRLEELVSCPTALSYYIGSNMPIQDHTRQELLEIDTTLERLKREIQLLEGMDMLRCNCCGEVIARRSDVFVMSTEGAIGAYVNAHGYVHETLTLSCARNMRIRGAPQTENSWFPGYAWILAKCQGCYLNRREQHMGWRFIAVDPDTRPQTFWGIRRTQLIGSSESQPPYWD